MHRYVLSNPEGDFREGRGFELYNPDVSRRCPTKRKRRLKKPHSFANCLTRERLGWLRNSLRGLMTVGSPQAIHR